MKNNELGVLLIGIVIGIYLLAGIQLVAGTTYRDGQIDALSKKIYYHLVQQDDRSSKWEKIK